MIFKILFIIGLLSAALAEGYSQETPSLSHDGFVTLTGDWDGEYIVTQPDGSFDTLDMKIDATITSIERGIAVDFLISDREGNSKLDTDTILISEDGSELDMGRIWTITEIAVDAGDTILMLDRKEQTDKNETHYLRSILRAGPDKFAILTAVRRKAGEDYFLEEQYRFTRK
jgi:hypothetical protein